MDVLKLRLCPSRNESPGHLPGMQTRAGLLHPPGTGAICEIGYQKTAKGTEKCSSFPRPFLSSRHFSPTEHIFHIIAHLVPALHFSGSVYNLLLLLTRESLVFGCRKLVFPVFQEISLRLIFRQICLRYKSIPGVILGGIQFLVRFDDALCHANFHAFLYTPGLQHLP